MTVLTTNNLLRRERLQSQERLSAQTVERVPLDVAQTILDLEVGGGHVKYGDDDGDQDDNRPQRMSHGACQTSCRPRKTCHS